MGRGEKRGRGKAVGEAMLSEGCASKKFRRSGCSHPQLLSSQRLMHFLCIMRIGFFLFFSSCGLEHRLCEGSDADVSLIHQRIPRAVHFAWHTTCA